ncbi:hypothetical protein CVT24_008196 [Panaeolus cyanescens]|uniref:Uncharacterized protein n=1 Tax=Panaeolus cyanescens TaxID=181874 RepID=A0A409YR56_9AGAR|nr:hypothetical protein CVT24_008196 [Panaeolus cyanescens]
MLGTVFPFSFKNPFYYGPESAVSVVGHSTMTNQFSTPSPDAASFWRDADEIIFSTWRATSKYQITDEVVALSHKNRLSSVGHGLLAREPHPAGASSTILRARMLLFMLERVHALFPGTQIPAITFGLEHVVHFGKPHSYVELRVDIAKDLANGYRVMRRSEALASDGSPALPDAFFWILDLSKFRVTQFWDPKLVARAFFFVLTEVARLISRPRPFFYRISALTWDKVNVELNTIASFVQRHNFNLTDAQYGTLSSLSFFARRVFDHTRGTAPPPVIPSLVQTAVERLSPSAVPLSSDLPLYEENDPLSASSRVTGVPSRSALANRVSPTAGGSSNVSPAFIAAPSRVSIADVQEAYQKVSSASSGPTRLLYLATVAELASLWKPHMADLWADPSVARLVFGICNFYQDLEKSHREKALPFKYPQCYHQVVELTKIIHTFRDEQKASSAPAVATAVGSGDSVGTAEPVKPLRRACGTRIFKSKAIVDDDSDVEVVASTLQAAAVITSDVKAAMSSVAADVDVIMSDNTPVVSSDSSISSKSKDPAPAPDLATGASASTADASATAPKLSTPTGPWAEFKQLSAVPRPSGPPSFKRPRTEESSTRQVARRSAAELELDLEVLNARIHSLVRTRDYLRHLISVL